MERNVPVTCCIGGIAIGSEEPGLAETGRDSSIFDAPVLMDGCLSCGQNVLKTREGSLESCMADNRLVRGSDSDTHRRQGCQMERRRGGGEGVTRVKNALVNKGRRGPNCKEWLQRNVQETDRLLIVQPAHL